MAEPTFFVQPVMPDLDSLLSFAYDIDINRSSNLFSWLNRFQGLGALVMRLVLGIIMVRHGYTKIIPSGALYTFSHSVAHMNLPVWLGYVAAFTEFFGGMLLVIGLLTRVAAVGTAIDMAVAIIKVHLHGGLIGPNSFAFPLALFAISLMLVFTGCGWIGLDDFVGRGGATRAKSGWAAK